MLSALTNTVLAILVSNHVNRVGFGVFSVAFLVFGICIGIERALVGQPMSIRYSGAEGSTLAVGRARATGTALVVGTVGGLGCIVVGTNLSGLLGDTLVATGVVLPFLLVQDACRLIFFAASRARSAAANDAVWAVLQLSGVAVLPLLTRPTVPLLVLIWGGAAAVSAVLALVQLSVLPNPLGAAAWLREHKDISGYLVAEYLLGTGAFQGGIVGVGALVGGDDGLAIVGAFRAAQVVLGPLNMLATAQQTFALPELSKRTWLTRRQRTMAAAALSSGLGTVALGYALALLVMPDAWGEALFSDSWAGARAVLLPLSLGVTARALSEGCAVVIYSMGMARRTFRVMAIEAPLVFTLMIGGALVGGAVGAAWGMFLDQALLVPVWYSTLRAAVRDAEHVPVAVER